MTTQRHQSRSDSPKAASALEAAALFVSTGSTSSDRLLVPVLAELRRRGWRGPVAGAGGSPLRDVGVELFLDTTALASMGLVAGLQGMVQNASTCLAALRRIERHFRRARPALVILVDNAGSNLPLVLRAHRYGIPILYLAPPELWSVWPWEMRSLIEKPTLLAPIFQSEADLLAQRGGCVRWVGHPLVDLLAGLPRPEGSLAPGNAPTIGLFPGSRRQEVRVLLPVLRGAAALLRRAVPHARFLLSAANEVVTDLLRADLPAWETPVELVQGRSYEVLAQCDLLLTCSGTATLEAALLGVPHVAMYRVESALDRVLTHLKLYRGGFPFLALPNAIVGRRVVPELISEEVTAERVAAEGLALVRDEGRRRHTLAGLAEVKSRLGPPGAIGRVADLVEDLLDRGRTFSRVSAQRVPMPFSPRFQGEPCRSARSSNGWAACASATTP